MVSRLVQLLKAYRPNVVIPSGKVTDFRFLQYSKQPVPNSFIRDGIVTSTRPEPSKHATSIFVILLGRFIDERCLQYSKQPDPNDTIPSGKVTNVKPE